MSNPSTPNLDLEALELSLLPAWAQQSPSVNRFAAYEGGGDEPRGRGRGDRPGRPFRREGDMRPPRREGGPPRRDAGGPRRDAGPRPPGAGPRGPRRDDRRDDRREGRREGGREPLREAPPLPEVRVQILPEEKGTELLARQIKLTGRAYPVFDIAQLILRKPERYQVRFDVVKKPDGTIAQQLWLCQLDDSLWLSEAEAVSHVLRRHFATFYQAERTPADPPKGTYTFVAQCGLSGVVLGPPNYHDYQKKLHKLHTERFSRMPFEVYKLKVRIVRDEAVVKQWVDEQSWKTEFICLNVPEALKLPSMEEVEKHFRETHLANVIRIVEGHTLVGAAAHQLPARPLRDAVRAACDEQRRFPLKLVTVLSQILASHGLHFFKVRKSITHVSVARPRYLDLEATVVSDGIRRIVDLIQADAKCTRRTLLDKLAPTPAPAATPATPPTAAAPNPAGDSTATPAAGGPAQPATPAATPPTEPAAPTAEQTAVISDLHWLVHEGHVIEFSNGVLELAKKPLPKPPKPAPQPAARTADQPPTTPAAATDTATTAPAPETAETAPETAEAAAEATPQAEAGIVSGDPAATTANVEPAVEVAGPETSPANESISAEPAEAADPTKPEAPASQT